MPPKTDFLSHFKQRFTVSNGSLLDILSDETLWTKSIPHEESGPCYTYDPPAMSDPGWYYGMNIFPTGDWEDGLEIFLHPRDKFFYFKESPPPNNARIDVTKLYKYYNINRKSKCFHCGIFEVFCLLFITMYVWRVVTFTLY